MNDIPIIMSAPTVPALLREARIPSTGKTETRRLAWKPWHEGGLDYSSEALEHFDTLGWNVEKREGGLYYLQKPSPWQLVNPGDRLWVREVLVPHSCGFDYNTPDNDGIYLSDLTDEQVEFWNKRAGDDPDTSPKVSPIHMPRWASRLTLIVTAAKIERLHDINDVSARAEGVEPAIAGVGPGGLPVRNYRTGFVYLWGKLHGTESWLSNPEVVAIKFIPHLYNIDNMPKAEAA